MGELDEYFVLTHPKLIGQIHAVYGRDKIIGQMQLAQGQCG